MQVPASFQYRKATSVEHALAVLHEYGPEAAGVAGGDGPGPAVRRPALLPEWGAGPAVVAGGHSVLPMMKLRLAPPEALVDINDLDEIAGIRVEDGVLVIGAMARHADLLAHAEAGAHFPLLHAPERVSADPIVAHRGP